MRATGLSHIISLAFCGSEALFPSKGGRGGGRHCSGDDSFILENDKFGGKKVIWMANARQPGHVSDRTGWISVYFAQ